MRSCLGLITRPTGSLEFQQISEKANSKRPVHLSAEKLIDPMAIHLRKIMYALFLIFTVTAINQTPAWLPGSVSCRGPNP